MNIFTQYKGLRKELYVLLVGRIMTNMGSMIWPMLTLILNQKLGMSAGEIAKWMVVLSLAGLPLNLLGGKLADKLNKRNIIVVCDLVSIAAYVYCYFVPVSYTSIIIFAVASFFQKIEWPSYDALVADFTLPKDRDRAYSLSYLGSNLGLVLSPTIGGLLFNEHLNLAFLINGISIGLSTLLIFFLIHDVHRETDDSVENAYEKAIEDDTPTFHYLRSNRVILLYIIFSAIAESVYIMWDYLMPMDLALAHGAQGSVIYGTITSVNCIEVVICTAFVTSLVSRFRGTTRIMMGQSLILAGYVIFMFCFRTVWVCYVAIIVFTLGEIVNTISASPFMSRRIPASHRGRIISVGAVASSLVGSVVQLVVGKVYDAKGSLIAWTTVLAIGAVMLSLLMLLRNWDRKDYPAFYR